MNSAIDAAPPRVLPRTPAPGRRAQSGFVRSALVLLVMLAVGAGAAGAGYMWRDRTLALELAELEHLRGVRARLEDARDGARGEIERLRGALAATEVELQMVRGEREEIATGLREAQGELAGAQEQLSFYQTLVPGDAKLDLVIKEFGISRRIEGYRFRAVLTRKSGRRVTSSGSLRIAVSGMRDGKRVRLGHRRLLDGESVRFRVQQFRQVDGDFSLPGGFVPERVEVELRVNGDDGGRAKRIFEWARAVG